MSEQELFEDIIDSDPFGEATDWDWEDFWAFDEFLEDHEIEEEEDE